MIMHEGITLQIYLIIFLLFYLRNSITFWCIKTAENSEILNVFAFFIFRSNNAYMFS